MQCISLQRRHFHQLLVPPQPFLNCWFENYSWTSQEYSNMSLETKEIPPSLPPHHAASFEVLVVLEKPSRQGPRLGLPREQQLSRKNRPQQLQQRVYGGSRSYGRQSHFIIFTSVHIYWKHHGEHDFCFSCGTVGKRSRWWLWDDITITCCSIATGNAFISLPGG